eukprot:CAMPEP_0196809872 /NCGR_PEP_ID=MMETSP1362-20130617/9750_1 /TAXON_ID=163516 /ORGANISM="Leptocylindrus danicus, Strain CCMP1856" /LENGTH=155 /DNA_ID=CAMNT_0042184691 /DNA_START=42 /DNA_END=509 /DNA_ORIENTATION=+
MQKHFLLFLLLLGAAQAFSSAKTSPRAALVRLSETTDAAAADSSSPITPTAATSPNDIVACRIQIQGAAQGGYFRAHVKNEAGRFRKLIGTMSPPSEDPKAPAEIYVEGKRRSVEGFVRWCKKGDVGLNQRAIVLNVSYDELPTGMYDDFYVKTK